MSRVNNAEGALRWPGELYRLNGFMIECQADVMTLIQALFTIRVSVYTYYIANDTGKIATRVLLILNVTLFCK